MRHRLQTALPAPGASRQRARPPRGTFPLALSAARALLFVLLPRALRTHVAKQVKEISPSRLGLRAHRKAQAKDAVNLTTRVHTPVQERGKFARTPASVLLCGALLALSSLALAPSAQAAAGPVVATGTNTFDGHGGSIVRAYVNREGEALTSCLFEYGETEGAYDRSEACLGRDEVQTVRLDATAGKFRLRFEGEATSDIPVNASAALVQERLEALPSIGQGNVYLGVGTNPYRVVFTGALAERNVEALGWEQGSEPLSGSFASATISTEAQGGATGLEYLNATAAEEAVEVTMDPAGLKPGAVYHFRISATSAAGTTHSGDSFFATPATPEPESCPNEARRIEQHSTYLPECRAYEMVSPPDKNGGDVMASTNRVQAAVDGNSAAFSSLTAFGDPTGASIATQYMSERTAAPGTVGWSTHAIAPPQLPLSYSLALNGQDTHYEGDLSEDLSKGVIFSSSPLTEDANVVEVGNLYRREDLHSPGSGTYSLLTGCPVCSSPFSGGEILNVPRYAYASTDFSHILFRSSLKLTVGAGSTMNAYEWNNGSLQLAGVLPSGHSAASSAPAGALSLETSTYGVHSVSRDGSKVFFQAPVQSSSTNLYMRLNGTETVQINASEKTNGADSHQGAEFQDASADGSRVFFATSQALTNDAPINQDRKLYMYDTTKPASDPHNLIYLSLSHEPSTTSNDVSGVLGASEDGSTAYFVSSGQLASGAPRVTSNAIYAWHDGQIFYVTSLFQNLSLIRDPNSLKLSRVVANGDLVFSSSDSIGPTGYDQQGCTPRPCGELYLYRIRTHTLLCLSCSSVTRPSASATDNVLVGNGATSQPVMREPRALTATGSVALFSTADALVPEDTNGVSDAYIYDGETGEVRLISSGTGSEPSYAMELNPNGHDIFFVTRQRLLGWDRDGGFDLYDARLGGGFPEPAPAEETCVGESCRSPVPPSPIASSPSSSVVNGPGNPPAVHHPRCHKQSKGKKRSCRRRRRHTSKHHRRVTR